MGDYFLNWPGVEALRRDYNHSNPPHFPIYQAISLVLIYWVILIVLPVTMLIAAKLSSIHQDFPITETTLFATVNPAALILGTIVAGLFVLHSYYRETDSVSGALTALAFEYLDSPRSQHLITFIAGFGLAVACTTIFGAEFKNGSDYASFINEAFPAWRISRIITMLLLAPVFEEIIFRGVLFNAIAGRFGQTIFVLVSSILFGAIHLHQLTGQPGAAASIFLFGLLASLIRVWSCRLGPCITFHLACNLLVVIKATTGTAS
jgi:membrane protease YdiL (CAAX protease family)